MDNVALYITYIIEQTVLKIDYIGQSIYSATYDKNRKYIVVVG